MGGKNTENASTQPVEYAKSQNPAEPFWLG